MHVRGNPSRMLESPCWEPGGGEALFTPPPAALTSFLTSTVRKLVALISMRTVMQCEVSLSVEQWSVAEASLAVASCLHH
jgi:hypothetical protein